MGQPLEIAETKFDEAVLRAKTPVIVDFWAPRCAPCHLVDPIIEELAKEYEGKAAFFKMNRDDNFKIANRYNIMSLPTVMVFKNGRPVSSIIGFTKDTRRNLKENIGAVL
jgi:thioredoxin 1